MKTSFYFAAAAAALLMASSAQAGDGISFNIDGQKIRIEAPRNCSSLSCISVTSNGSAIDMKNTNLKGRKSDDDVATTSAPPAPPAPPAPAVQAPPAPAPVANTAPPAPPAPPAVANNVPRAPAPAADSPRERLTGLPSTPPARATSTVPATPAPAPVANAAPAAPPAPPAPPVQQEAAATPLGLWQTEDNKGNVRIEQCGANLCGYGEKNGEKSGELVLVNMKPSSDNSKWTGRIHNPESGSNYDSIVSMKGPNLLKVQGCAFGGAFCGGTTWKRIS